MDIHRSIDKRVKRIHHKIKSRYLRKIRHGKDLTYYYHASFYPLYLKRILWLLLAMLTFKPGTYGRLFKINKKNWLKALFFDLFGYGFLVVKNLYPSYAASDIIKNKKVSFDKKNNLLVSIIIPVYNNLSYTYNCLLSIKERVSSLIDYEVLVIDDNSTDETETFFRNSVTGITYIRNTENLGYLHSNNKAVDQAHGLYICLLNNDTEVQNGWLESMVELIESDKKIGCVGSKLIYPNNLLQEAGGIIYKDGNGANFGRLREPDDFIYNFVREVDYCSAASILLKKEDFIALGKFDTRYAPAYYEDTDLCFGIRNILHKKVMYQPFSCVVHHEGITSGKEIAAGSVKHYQEGNRFKFMEKWQQELKAHDPEGYRKSYRRLLPESAILVVDWSLPKFDQDSGSLRMFRLLKLLKSLQYHVIFIPENNVRTDYYYNRLLKAGIEVRFDLHAGHSVNDFDLADYFPSVRYIWISRPEINALYKDKVCIFKHAKWIYDTVDLHYIRMRREAELTNEDTSKLNIALKMKELEISLAKEADMTITVTADEQQQLESLGITDVHTIPNIHIPAPANCFKSFDERAGIVFIGGYEHAPNVDAVIWFTENIWPAVNHALPDVTLYLLGSKPPQEVLNLQNDQIIVPGYVPDVSAYFQNGRIFISPLRYGAGMKGKIGQALEFKLPVITTSIGAEGMGLEHEKHVLIADDPILFARNVVQLYTDKELWERLTEASKEALYPYSPEVVKSSLAQLFSSLANN